MKPVNSRTIWSGILLQTYHLNLLAQFRIQIQAYIMIMIQQIGSRFFSESI